MSAEILAPSTPNPAVSDSNTTGLGNLIPQSNRKTPGFNEGTSTEGRWNMLEGFLSVSVRGAQQIP